jgi:hypothetical protein
MKINVALFITALSTAGRRHGVLPVVSAASAAGDDGAAATTTTVDRPHLRALLQNDDNRLAACSAPVQNGSCDNMFCNNCNQGQTQCTTIEFSDGDALWEGVACCIAGGNQCYDPTGAIPGTSLFIKADEEVPQDFSTTTDKLGDDIEAVVPSSSTLRASSLLKDNNVFTKQDGDETEDFLELAGCPAAGWNGQGCTANYCADCNGKPNCQSRHYPCPDGMMCITERYYLLCCNANGNCNGEFPDMEDAVMIIPQDTDKLDASSPLRASLLKVE